MKKSHLKVVAVVLCFAFILMTVPSLNAEKKAAKIDLRLLIKQPGILISYLFPFLGNSGRGVIVSKGSSSGARVKPTGDSPSPRPGTQD